MNNNVNLFFACDDGYIPFLAVTLGTIKAHRDKNRSYNAKILHTGISKCHKTRILESLSEEGFEVEFVDITSEVAKISDRLHTRDYYSKSTYFRLFIPELYKDIDKALYLDCDLVLLSDVAELFDIDLKDNLVGAVSDGFVSSVPRLHDYVTERVGVNKPRDYFNAGVLLINCRRFREKKVLWASPTAVREILH
jgi:lipopolysaccharide biosynthesis glycosyltransferase